MSDTTAFLSGCALAGVATLVWLQGGLGLDKGNLPYPETPQYNQPVISDPSTSVTIPSSSTLDLEPKLKEQLEKQQTVNDELKAELQQQRAITEQLKTDLELQKTETGAIISQLQEQQRIIPAKAQQASRIQIGMLWALGGIVIILVVGGSVMLIGIVAILLRPQKRYSQPAHIVHPLSLPPEYGYGDYSGEFVYAQRRPRRVREVEQREE